VQIDTARFGNLAFGVVLGDSSNHQTIKVNMPSSTTSPNVFTIDAVHGYPIKFKISRLPGNIKVAVGTEVVDF
jgi:hypothetical protein